MPLHLARVIKMFIEALFALFIRILGTLIDLWRLRIQVGWITMIKEMERRPSLLALKWTDGQSRF